MPDPASYLACARNAWSAGTGPIIFTVATHLSEAWVLGLSAAQHGLPLVVAGLGLPGWSWHLGSGGNVQKLAIARRALRVLHLLAPNVPVIFADATDTMILNPPTASNSGWAASLQWLRASGGVLVSAECNSYPRCYRRLYARLAEHQACLRAWSACYPNSGLYAGGSAGALLRLLQLTLRKLKQLQKAGGDGYDDQAALHGVYLDPARNLSVRTDGAGNAFVSLWACTGVSSTTDDENTPGLSRRCFARPHDPFRGVSYTLGANGTLNYELGSAFRRGARPVVAHANGDHARLYNPELARLLQPYVVPAPRLLHHPVLLLHGEGFDCRVSSVREVTRQREGAGASVAAQRWLQAAALGYCAETTGPGNCERGNKGSWTLQADETRSWDRAATVCLQHCAGCARCQHVSISLWHADCSWFASCQHGQLQQGVAGFRSAAVPLS